MPGSIKKKYCDYTATIIIHLLINEFVAILQCKAATYLQEDLLETNIFSRHDGAAAGGAVVRAGVLIDAPVAGPGALDARHARGVATAVVESEVARHEIFVGFAGPNCQGHQGMVHVGRDGGPVYERRCGTPESLVHYLGIRWGSGAPNTLVLGPRWQFRQRAYCQFHL